MMEQLINYLSGLRGDVFKLLPMKESEMKGVRNHLSEYMDSLIINLNGAMITYPWLLKQKHFLNVVNNVRYLQNTEVDFSTWRKIILSSTRGIDDLYTMLGGEGDGK